MTRGWPGDFSYNVPPGLGPTLPNLPPGWGPHWGAPKGVKDSLHRDAALQYVWPRRFDQSRGGGGSTVQFGAPPVIRQPVAPWRPGGTFGPDSGLSYDGNIIDRSLGPKAPVLGGGRTPAALGFGGGQLSYVLTLGGGRGGLILPGKIPPPPSGALAGLGILLGLGLLLELGKQLWPVSPPGGVIWPGKQEIHPGLIYRGRVRVPDSGGWTWDTSTGYSGAYLPVDAMGVGTSDTLAGRPNTAFFRPDRNTSYYALPAGTNPNPPNWMGTLAGFTITAVPNNYFYGRVREIRRKNIEQSPTLWRWTWQDEVDVWQNKSGASVAPEVVTPPVWVIPLAPETWPVRHSGRGGVATGGRPTTVPGVVIPPVIIVEETTPHTGSGVTVPVAVSDIPEILPGRDRGIAVTTDGEVIHPMTPMREVKTAAAPALYRMIMNTVGGIGEAIDVTRCFVYATGNTYVGRDGAERAVPKWRWLEAMEALVSGDQSLTAIRRKKTVSVRVGSNIVTPDGRILTPEDVGRRLAGCLAANAAEDAIIGIHGQTVLKMQRDLRLTAGPFGFESLYGAALGGVPYEDFVNLYL